MSGAIPRMPFPYLSRFGWYRKLSERELVGIAIAIGMVAGAAVCAAAW